MFDLTTIGDIKLDVFIDLGDDAKVMCSTDKEACEMRIKYGQKIPVDSAITMMAGSAPNVAIGARRLGLSADIISVVGNDTTATLAIDTLKKEGIATEHVHISQDTASSFSAILNFEGESTVLAVHHPHTYVLPGELKTKWAFVSELGSNYQDLFKQLIASSQEHSVKLGINPGAIQLEERDPVLFELIKACELLIVNKEEAKDLLHVEVNEIEALLRGLQELGPRVIVITDGRNGAYATEDGTIYHAPMFSGERVEATGAGDAFSTGVLAALIAEQNLSTALTWGSVNSANVVQHVGPQAGLQTRAQIDAQLSQHPYSVETL